MHNTARRMNRRLMFTVEPVGGEPSGAGPAAAQPADKAFTQSDLDRVATREKDQGRRAGMKELATEYGFENVEDFRTFVAAQKAAAEAALTDEQRRVADLATKEADLARRETDLKAKEAETARADALRAAGVPADAVADALVLLGVGLAADADAAAVTAATDALKARRPEFFTATPGGEQQPPVRPSGAPAGYIPPNSVGQGAATAGSRGAAEARRRFGDRANLPS